MFVLKPTNQFDKDVKLMKKRSLKNINLIKDFLFKLEIDGASGIDKKHHPHKLVGNYKDNWEAHIKPDLLIIWFEITEEKEIILLRVGTHSDLFK
ncbi:type II toxin-antitoxin system YafQ family toxin [Pedobacter sp. CFBP9032]|uniref:type II toxin-antitoxin system YafQ family toxin n=1 Tax=Pedobacter sp. CFBP9032 TaxID=3096539 RepID=UPI002A6A262A|nr:type II toxin-antitoxin system YafQ family toxin [Pedobacter sp. CFBP9032]MDY0906963.1 type II toxin-antitoxin system YafQ family toxin [Pedobacter sp. CFBP9032]